jgi:acetyl esterase/lipase
MPSLVARAARRYARSVIKPTREGPDEVVRHLRRVLDHVPAPSWMPRGVARRPVAADEPGGPGGEWVGVPAATRTLLYHHGGAYVSGRPSTYRNLAARLARELRADVLLARYRLAPEHPHPAALDDAFATYRALLARVDPAALALCGDSAGGGLTLALLQRVRDAGLPLPAAAVLLSPWTDLGDDAPSRAANAEADAMLSRAMLRGAAAAYLAGADPQSPAASPVHGGLADLPPLLVAVDDTELLLDDATRVVEGVRAAGGDATLVRRSGLLHVWPVLVPLMREARETADEIVDFLEARLAT